MGKKEQTQMVTIKCQDKVPVAKTESKVRDQNGISPLNNMLEIYHSGPEPSTDCEPTIKEVPLASAKWPTPDRNYNLA